MTLKLNHPIKFPVKLDLSSFTSDDFNKVEYPSLHLSTHDTSNVTRVSSSQTKINDHESMITLPINPVTPPRSDERFYPDGNDTDDETTTVFEDDNGWLCPHCFGINLKMNEFCSSCVYIRKKTNGLIEPDRLLGTPESTNRIPRDFNSMTFRKLVPSPLNINDRGDTPPSCERSFKRFKSGHEPSSSHSSARNVNQDQLNDVTGNDSTSKSNCEYTLTAVVRHQGGASGYGHYICDKFVKGGTNISGRYHWERCNDSYVHELNEVSVSTVNMLTLRNVIFRFISRRMCWPTRRLRTCSSMCSSETIKSRQSHSWMCKLYLDKANSSLIT